MTLHDLFKKIESFNEVAEITGHDYRTGISVDYCENGISLSIRDVTREGLRIVGETYEIEH